MVFIGKVFQEIIGIPMGTSRAPLLADIFLYSYEAEFVQSLISTGRKRLASQFNFTYRYMDDKLSIYNPVFENNLGQMYPREIEIKDTTESNTSASYLELLMSIDRTFNVTIPFTRSVTIFISILQNFPQQQHPIFARLWCFYLTTDPMRKGLLLLWMFYSEGGATFQ